MPDHDSGHAVEGGVAAEILKQVFGADEVLFFTCGTTVGAGRTCEDPSPVFRSYRVLGGGGRERGVADLIGIHFRRAVEEGVGTDGKLGSTRFTGS